MTLTPKTISNPDWSWPYWPLVPIYPYGQRRTRRVEVIPEQLWLFEQVQGIFYVVVPIRMTVVKLATGGLLVYAPVALTPECLRLLQEIINQHGTVKHIILPTISGVEHKVPVAPFARQFPKAQVWVTPGHWSFPLNLPLTWLGLPPRRTQVLPADSTQTPFGKEFDYAILGPLNLGLGKFGETVFFHRRSRSLLVTDVVLSVSEIPPEVVQLDPYPLLFHARDEPTDAIRDLPGYRTKGWQRICLFALYFRPSTLETIDLPQAWQAAKGALDRSAKAYWGLYPFDWAIDWQASFQALHQNGRLQVAPILQQLILNRDPAAVRQWCDRVAQWNFKQIIPCHFTAPIAVEGTEFQQAFTFLHQKDVQAPSLARQDSAVLSAIDAELIKRKITPPPNMSSF
ncbi:MAG: DUF4336 domain-containing protein [Spirulina sp. SIO3F2]|nr:DUF4336 domain-containing protein [Spirulina sp. SIO3F2]